VIQNFCLKGLAFLWFTFGLFFLAIPSQAQTTTNVPVSAVCTGGGQLCNNIATIPVSTAGLLQGQFISDGGGACSDVRIHFLVDGSEVAATGFVAPGGSSAVLNLGPVSSGPHVVGLQAEGQVGGCNVGTLGSWEGTAAITTEALAAAVATAVPTLPQWGFIGLGLLLGYLGISYMRRLRIE